jgi:hypothetical protein
MAGLGEIGASEKARVWDKNPLRFFAAIGVTTTA